MQVADLVRFPKVDIRLGGSCKDGWLTKSSEGSIALETSRKAKQLKVEIFRLGECDLRDWEKLAVELGRMEQNILEG